MFKQPSIKMALLSFVLLLLLMAFAPLEALGQQPRPGGTLRLAIDTDMTRNMDARYPGRFSGNPQYWALYEFLVGFGPKGVVEIIPLLAESWKQVDPVTYIFNIRKGVKFHNGREMTAEDVKENLDWLLKTPPGWRPVTRRAYLATVIDKVETVDRYTLRLKLKGPFAPLLSTFRVVGQGIAPPEEVKKWGKDFTLHPSGTGPYKFVEQVPADRVILERFEGYWGKRPFPDRVVIRSIPDAQSRLIAVQTGEVDLARVELSTLPVVRRDRNLKIMRVGNITRYIGLWFNMRNWPISSLKFRQALTAGAQWDKYTEATYAGIPVRVPLEKSWAENAKAKELLPAYDPEKARRRVKEVEAEAGRSIPTLTFLSPAIYYMAQMGELAKTQLKKIGVTVKVDVQEQITPAYQALKWDLLLISSAGSGDDPYFVMSAFTTTGEGDMRDGKNRMGYVNPKIDELLKRALATENQGERKKIYQEMEEIILKDLPGFYVFAADVIWAMNKRVQDFALINDGSTYLVTPWNNTWMEK